MAILRPDTTEDVAAGVKTANKLGMKGSRFLIGLVESSNEMVLLTFQQISVRSGGHDYICASLKNDSLHLDLRKINVIELMPEEEVPEKVS